MRHVSRHWTVRVAWGEGELDAIAGEHRMDFVRDSRDESFQKGGRRRGGRFSSPIARRQTCLPPNKDHPPVRLFDSYRAPLHRHHLAAIRAGRAEIRPALHNRRALLECVAAGIRPLDHESPGSNS
jgi:hypothetical protein